MYENSFIMSRDKGERNQFLYWVKYSKKAQNQWNSQVDYITDSIKGPINELKGMIRTQDEEIKQFINMQKSENRFIQNKFNEARKRQENIKDDVQKEIRELKVEMQIDVQRQVKDTQKEIRDT